MKLVSKPDDWAAEFEKHQAKSKVHKQSNVGKFTTPLKSSVTKDKSPESGKQSKQEDLTEFEKSRRAAIERNQEVSLKSYFSRGKFLRFSSLAHIQMTDFL